MTSLTDFLLARIAEDEARARPAWEERAKRRAMGLPVATTWPTPDRVLAECEAKRRIVEGHRHEYAEGDGRMIGDSWSCHTCHNGYTDWWCLTLRSLAIVYADHAEFRAEWAL